MNKNNFNISLAFLTILGLSFFLYLPGVSGPFLHDDFHNLKQLGTFGGISDWHTFKQFVFGGSSGPFGRPVALLTFTLDDQAWPSSPESFKYTNILIHLLVGISLYILLLQLKKYTNVTKFTASTLLLCFSIWLLHPLNITTVLYVIQRMTELSTLFSLLALSCYIFAKVNSKNPYKLILSLIGFGTFSILGIFSKENAVNILLYALVLDFTLLRNIETSKNWKYIRFIIIILPLIFLAYHFLSRSSHIIKRYEARDFSLLERLFTEPRVLFYGLSQLFLPTLSGYTIFHDDFVISKSLFNPYTTFVSIFFLFLLIVSAVFLRKKQPVFSFAVLWFFSGHILESSFLPLEIFYEHRNYMPIMGPILAFSYYLEHFSKQLFYGISGVLLIYISLMTYQNTNTWSNEKVLHSVNALDHPNSFRSQIVYTTKVLSQQNPELLSRQYAKLDQIFPNRFAIRMQQLVVSCFDKVDTQQHIDRILELKNERFDFNDGMVFKNWATRVSEQHCAHAGRKYIYSIGHNLLQHAKQNKSHSIGLGRIHLTLSEAYSRDGNLDKAIYHLDEAYKSRAEINLAKKGAIIMVSAGLFDEALKYIEKAKNLDLTLQKRQPSRMTELLQLEKDILTLKRAMNEKS